MTFANDDVVHIRPSGNAPELRIYVEGANEEDLISFGMHNGGNWLLVFDVTETNTANPMVYEVDHEPGCPIVELCPLLQLLKSLRLE